MKSKFLRFGFLLCFLPLLSGCSALTRASLARHRGLWQSQGIADYRYTIRMGCFCPYIDPVTFEVRDGQTVSIVDRDGNTYSGNINFRDYFKDVDTIDRVFQFIEYAVSNADIVSVKYNKQLGYPVEISINWKLGWTDSSSGYHITGFQTLEAAGAFTPSESFRHPYNGMTNIRDSRGRTNPGLPRPAFGKSDFDGQESTMKDRAASPVFHHGLKGRIHGGLRGDSSFRLHGPDFGRYGNRTASANRRVKV